MDETLHTHGAPVDGKFTERDVAALRNDLLQSGLDSWQAAELVASFLAVRGYGISAGEARKAVEEMEFPQASLTGMHRTLEGMARAM